MSSGNSNRVANIPQLSPHPKYTLTGADFFVLIETTLFSFHYYFIERDTTSFLPPPKTTLKPGEKRKNEWNSQQRALVLTDQDVTVEDFENFLWIWYNDTHNIYDAPLITWVGILKLATRWGCKEMTRLALSEVNSAPKDYRLRLWTRLAMRETAPSEEEEKILSPKAVCKVFRMREEVRSPGGRSPVPDGVDVEEATSIVAGFLDWEYTRPATSSGGSYQ
ncbi:hypothetical protein CC1G_10854 [Coprinopsis cinerea okayama7|uniref:BTB domain-containing protein n=1 Tax=Coprinopsis cinerea (strain Okayama-7 / 130 / ATCC MYA-4618 / FGSC 9003) TaxID=240176 RepID=A8NKS8_COPC7|nr:hypothetical protein CC1G_10854 [Coprinopsis cinerea okayama7\|eukprot:XP_001834536.2 hypothetical protein CC1G_10854 [Coprinopsis cinerea okayama7\